MSPGPIFTQSVVRIRPGTATDRGGNTVDDWSPGAVTRTEITRLSVQPTTSTETTDETRDAVVTGWHVLSAPGTVPDVTARDRCEISGGLVCEVVGEVAEWTDPVTGAAHHREWTLRRATG